MLKVNSMKLCKSKFKEKANYFYLDAVDYVNAIDLNNFVIPEKVEFTSIKQMVEYAMELVPATALESFASFHYIKNDVMKEEIAMLFKYDNSGNLQTFKC